MLWNTRNVCGYFKLSGMFDISTFTCPKDTMIKPLLLRAIGWHGLLKEPRR